MAAKPLSAKSVVDEVVRIAPMVKDKEVRDKLAKGVKQARSDAKVLTHSDGSEAAKRKLGSAYKRWGAYKAGVRTTGETVETETNFVLDEEVWRLTEGSYESLLPRLCEALTDNAKRLFGADEDITLIATFKNHAIAMTESMDVFRVKYETAQNGSISPISAEPLHIKKRTVSEQATKTARSFVEAFIAGSKSIAGEQFEKLFPLALETAVPLPPKKDVVESFAATVSRDSAWKKLYIEKVAEIRESVGTDFSNPDYVQLFPKFHRLLDGTIVEPELAGYDGLVTSDLKYLQGRVEIVLTEASEAFSDLLGAVPALKSSADPTVRLFETFAADYVEDLGEVVNLFVEATNSTNRIDVRAKLYDDFAKELHRFEVAGRFVFKMSESLKAVTEESINA